LPKLKPIQQTLAYYIFALLLSKTYNVTQPQGLKFKVGRDSCLLGQLHRERRVQAVRLTLQLSLFISPSDVEHRNPQPDEQPRQDSHGDLALRAPFLLGLAPHCAYVSAILMEIDKMNSTGENLSTGEVIRA
jgi:hypothetical protein